MTPTAQAEVTGARKTIAISAIVDTGFEGFVCLPVRLAVHLGLELTGQQVIELADGTRKEELEHFTFACSG